MKIGGLCFGAALLMGVVSSVAFAERDSRRHRARFPIDRIAGLTRLIHGEAMRRFCKKSVSPVQALATLVLIFVGRVTGDSLNIRLAGAELSTTLAWSPVAAVPAEPHSTVFLPGRYSRTRPDPYGPDHVVAARPGIPAGAGPTDDIPFMIDTTIRPIPKTWTQFAPAVAFDGENYLVAWQDYIEVPEDPGICCTRVSPSGRILDPASGIPVGPVSGIQAYPAVAFGGGVYLVTWVDSSASGFFIMGARLAPSGVVLDSPGFVITSTPSGRNPAATTSDGTDFLVVWGDGRGGTADIYGARVSQSGQVLDPNGIAISTADAQQSLPAVAFGGGCYTVVWQDDRNGDLAIYGSRVSTSAQVLDPSGIRVSDTTGTQEMPSVAFDGANFLEDVPSSVE